MKSLNDERLQYIQGREKLFYKQSIKDKEKGGST